jgi:hypothetical protein
MADPEKPEGIEQFIEALAAAAETIDHRDPCVCEHPREPRRGTAGTLDGRVHRRT